MRVLEAFGEPISYGGQEAFVRNMIEKMDLTDLQIDLLTPYYCDNEAMVSLAAKAGGRVCALGCRFAPGGIRNSAAGPIRKYLSENKYDVIHIHSGSNSMLAIYSRLAYEAGIRQIIVHSHCTGSKGFKHFASKLLTAPALSRFPHIYCACSEEAGEWRFPSRICRRDLKIINNGIDPDRFRYDEAVRNRMRKELGINADEVVICTVGRLTYQKNQKFLIDLMPEILRRSSGTGRSYRLMLVGDGEDREALRAESMRLGIADRIIMPGSADNVQDYLQAADVSALPSKYEGLAIAAIEAQSAGLDTIVSGAVPELAAVTGHISFIDLSDKEAWIKALMSDHSRHPDSADLVRIHGFGSERAAEIVRKLYFS